MTEDEKKYEDVINSLKSLQQVKAHPNFEADLKRRLNSEKYAREERSWFRKLFMPSRLLPSFGLAAAVVIVFMIVNVNSDEADNPFLMEPKIREDVILITEKDEVVIPENNLTGEPDITLEERVEDDTDRSESSGMMMEERSIDEGLIASREFTPPETTMTDETGSLETEEFSSPPATGFAIRKSALNFRQVNITEHQQQEIIELKEKIISEQENVVIK